MESTLDINASPTELAEILGTEFEIVDKLKKYVESGLETQTRILSRNVKNILSDFSIKYGNMVIMNEEI